MFGTKRFIVETMHVNLQLLVVYVLGVLLLSFIYFLWKYEEKKEI